MKAAFFIVMILTLTVTASVAQTTGFFLRTDTITLTSLNSNWMVPPAYKNEYKTLPGYFLQALLKGKLKASDPNSGKPIPAGKILSWDMPADTVLRYDMEGNTA